MNNINGKKGPKKVRFYQTDIQDQVGIFKTAQYSVPSEKINNLKTSINKNTTMNIRVPYKNKILSNPSSGKLGIMPQNSIRDSCLLRELNGRFDLAPYQNINAVQENYGVDSRYSKKSYN
jgi:hypothetical protein